MTFTLYLSPELTHQALAFLDCARERPSVRYLNRLIHAYIRHVPWESASRIVRRHTIPDTASCPRWPAEFWLETLYHGTGGTCFENNLAFFALLTTLGFEGYLTINDMETPACHTACVIALEGRKYLADIAIPVHCAIPLSPDRVTRRSTAFHNYTIHPLKASRYAIERSHHPKRLAFTLVDIPIPLEAYRLAVQQDYEATGFFLDRVIIIKVMNNRLWRFSSAGTPYRLESFDKFTRQEIPLEPSALAPTLAAHFGIDGAIIALALTHLQRHSIVKSTSTCSESPCSNAQ